ncbi:MAG TPA: CpsD/CapB family tyrosine-protein kinase [Ktedonobacteraceae bacterium]
MGSRIQEQRALLTDYDTDTAYSQAFYTLFANIRFHWESEAGSQDMPPTNTVHALQVTSASAYSGQATVTANLAIVAAQSGSETILVDADLRAPALRQRFGLSSGAGLSDLLKKGDITPQRIATCLQPTFVPGLRVLGAGDAPVQNSALLLSPHLGQVVTGLRDLLAASGRGSGVALFHSAAVLSGADAALIGALTDQTVLAIIVGQTTRLQAKQAQEQLEQAHTKLAGVVMLHP